MIKFFNRIEIFEIIMKIGQFSLTHAIIVTFSCILHVYIFIDVFIFLFRCCLSDLQFVCNKVNCKIK